MKCRDVWIGSVHENDSISLRNLSPLWLGRKKAKEYLLIVTNDCFMTLEELCKQMSSGIVNPPSQRRAKKPVRSWVMNKRSSCKDENWECLITRSKSLHVNAHFHLVGETWRCLQPLRVWWTSKDLFVHIQKKWSKLLTNSWQVRVNRWWFNVIGHVDSKIRQCVWIGFNRKIMILNKVEIWVKGRWITRLSTGIHCLAQCYSMFVIQLFLGPSTANRLLGPDEQSDHFLDAPSGKWGG